MIYKIPGNEMRRCNNANSASKIALAVKQVFGIETPPAKQLVTRFTESRWKRNADRRQMGSVDQPNRSFWENLMKTSRIVLAVAVAAAVASLSSGTAFAQNATSEVQRNANQQQRIERGLQSGQLNTREAARLEHEESRVDRMEAKAMQDGKLSDAEKSRISQAQNKVSRDIAREKHDAQHGDPNSPSSQRMQADVQRNINQQQRIAQGVRSGQLTNREAGRLERGQARQNRLQARAGADARVGRNEQQRIQMAENRQSGGIFREKHDAQQRAGRH